VTIFVTICALIEIRPPLQPEEERGGRTMADYTYFLYFSMIHGGIVMGTIPLSVTSGEFGVSFHL